jgi:hypothetical protein
MLLHPLRRQAARCLEDECLFTRRPLSQVLLPTPNWCASCSLVFDINPPAGGFILSTGRPRLSTATSAAIAALCPAFRASILGKRGYFRKRQDSDKIGEHFAAQSCGRLNFVPPKKILW